MCLTCTIWWVWTYANTRETIAVVRVPDSPVASRAHQEASWMLSSGLFVVGRTEASGGAAGGQAGRASRARCCGVDGSLWEKAEALLGL